MPTSTYTALATTTLASAAASVTFGSIPSTDTNGNTIRDLILIMDYNAASAAYSGKAYVNGDTTSGNYTSVRMVGNGSSKYSNANGGSIRWEIQTTGDAIAKLQFLDAKATDKHKTVLVRVDSAGTGTEGSVSRWANTAAITSITVEFGTNLEAGSTLGLYAVVA
jgi:hypothetical protein